MDELRCGAVLAGGASRRMGRPKALIGVEGEPLVRRVARRVQCVVERVVVVTASAEIGNAAGVEVIADEFPGAGPLAGVHAALRYFNEPCLVVGCDMPFLQEAVLRELARRWELETGADALVVEGPRGVEPLVGVYGVGVLPALTEVLEAGGKLPSMRRFLEQIATRVVPWNALRELDAEGRSFVNWNSPADVGAEMVARISPCPGDG